MNAYATKAELAMLSSSTISHADHIADANSRHVGAVARIKAFFARQRTLSELNSLSDRELTDIGLTRATIQTVFTRDVR